MQDTELKQGFLQEASDDELEAAVARNHHVWMTTKCRASGGEVIEREGVSWTFTPGVRSEGMILFPQLGEESADDQLNEIVAYYQDRRPEKHIGCWSLEPSQPDDLGQRLLRRGFQDGWKPRWMWLDLQKMKTEHTHPDALRIEIAEGTTDWDVDDLPYYDRDTEAIRRAAIKHRPQAVWHFGAWLDNQPVGHATLCLSTGDLGIAGIYDVGVVPDARGLGIGRSVTAAACLAGREMGCRHAMLNGTGEKMYNQIGFERLGFGKTWWWTGNGELQTV